MIRSCLKWQSLLFLLLLLLLPAPAHAHGPALFYITFYILQMAALLLTAFSIAVISIFIKKSINYLFVEGGECSGISIRDIRSSTVYEAIFLIILLIPHWYNFKGVYRSFEKIYLYIIDRICASDQQIIKYFNKLVSGEAGLWHTFFKGASVIFPIIIFSFIIHIYYRSDDQNSSTWKAISIVTPAILIFIYAAFSYYFIINKSNRTTSLKLQEKNLNELYLTAIRKSAGPRLIEAFLKEGADVDFKGNGSQTPLLLIFRHYGSDNQRFSRKRLKLLKLLLEHGADVNVKTRDGWTPLICSAWKGSTDAAELILQNGADIEGRDIWGRTALTFGNENMISLLVKRGADINTRDNRGRTLVIKIAASRFEETDMLKFLIKMRADLNLKDDEGRTALMEAASNKIVGINSVSERFSGYIWQSEAVKLLLDGGANPNARNKAGKTVLMIAASEWQLGRSRDYYEKQLQVVKTLLESGADINSGDNSGRTVLMLTLAEWQKKSQLSGPYNDNRRRMIKLLLDSGADLTIRDNDGKTISDFLTHVPPEYKNPIGDLLSSHGKRG